MDTIELHHDFKEFLKLLNVKNVEYLLIGGFAVNLHGYSRLTQEIDVWVARHPENARRIVEALREFGFDVPELTEQLFLAPGRIIRMGRAPVRIEISTTISGVQFDECRQRALVGSTVFRSLLSHSPIYVRTNIQVDEIKTELISITCRRDSPCLI